MSYLGNSPTEQSFVATVDYFNGNGSTVSFTLSRQVTSVAQVQAVIENVPQNPSSAFTVLGNVITFTSAPPAGTANIYVYYTSPNTKVIAPSSGTVGTDALAAGAVTAAKLASGAARANFGAGAVLQVVSATKVDAFSTASGSPVDVTGMSVSITPTSATSKILVLMQVFGGTDVNTAAYFTLVRNSTPLNISTAGLTYNSTMGFYFGNGNAYTTSPIMYLDSPNTTASTTYKLQVNSGGGAGTVYVNRRAVDTVIGGSSTITLMEIAG